MSARDFSIRRLALIGGWLLVLSGCSRTRGADPVVLVHDAGLGACARCDDGVFCNGRELCAEGSSCRPGEVVSCDDHDE